MTLKHINECPKYQFFYIKGKQTKEEDATRPKDNKIFKSKSAIDALNFEVTTSTQQEVKLADSSSTNVLKAQQGFMLCLKMLGSYLAW